MTKYKLSIIPIFLVLLSVLLFGCATKMEGKEVYTKFLEFSQKDDNIFIVTKNTENEMFQISLKVAYANEIENALNDETTIYENTGVPKSDFYLLKTIYEPTLNIALNFFINNFTVLQNSSKEISKEDAGVIYDAFYRLQDSIETFQNGLSTLNGYKKSFIESEQTQAIYYANKQSRAYEILDSFKIKYANMIDDCFNLNNKFIDLYNELSTSIDYRKNPTAELNGLYVQRLCTQTLAKLAQVGFMVDGVKCNFLNTNLSSFEIKTESNPTDHTYIVHLSEVLASSNKLNTLMTDDFQNINAHNEALKSKVKALQTQLETFEIQYPKFVKALKEINYRDYIASLNKGKTKDEYFATLSDKQRSYLTIVENFLNNNYLALCNVLANEVLANI